MRPPGCCGCLALGALALAAGVYLGRGAVLERVGAGLVAGDPPGKADAILVLSGAPVERVREAADLYREGWAPRVVLTTPEEPAGLEDLARRGIAVPTEPEVARTIAVGLGVPAAAILRVPEVVNSTGAEARAFRSWLRGRGWTRVLVVTSPFHTRRARRIFRSALAADGVQVAVVPSRHGEYKAGDWWRRRSGVRSLVIEYEKLLFSALPGG